MNAILSLLMFVQKGREAINACMNERMNELTDVK
jgi:hypothetical protein